MPASCRSSRCTSTRRSRPARAVIRRGCTRRPAPASWSHLVMGEEMLRSGALVPATDPYSYLNADYQVVDHEWLAHCIEAALFRLAGPTGLVILKLILSLGTLGLLYRHLCRQGL